MKVVYTALVEGLEKTILDAFGEMEEGKIAIGESKLNSPIVVNVSPVDLEKLKVLGVPFYKWVTEFRTQRNPTDAAMDRLEFRINRIVSAARKSGLDLLVIYDPEENIELIRDELKKCIRTK